MDFRCDQSEGFTYLYLTFSSTNALVESTRMSETLCPQKILQRRNQNIFKSKLDAVNTE